MIFYGLGVNGRNEVCNLLKERKQIVILGFQSVATYPAALLYPQPLSLDLLRTDLRGPSTLSM